MHQLFYGWQKKVWWSGMPEPEQPKRGMPLLARLKAVQRHQALVGVTLPVNA
jgi:hypothetical protein